MVQEDPYQGSGQGCVSAHLMQSLFMVLEVGWPLGGLPEAAQEAQTTAEMTLFRPRDSDPDAEPGGDGFAAVWGVGSPKGSGCWVPPQTQFSHWG